MPLASGIASAAGSPAAQTMFNNARGYEAAGRVSKAISTYRDIAKRYPHLDKQGDLFKAFEAYQGLISKYPGSKHYAAAVKRQEAVAQAAANGIIKNNFLGMKTRISPDKTGKMLAHVRDNAPRAASAPKAQYAIGRMWQQEGNADKAIAAYRRIGVDYPGSSIAPDALYQIGQILILKAERGNQNKANVNRAKDIFQNLIQRYPRHPRAADARKRLAILGGQDVQRSFDTAEFYRKKGQTQSALFYYREVIRKTKGGTLHNKAKQRISSLGG